MANEYYFPWYPAHYRRDAGHLDHVSDSCYRRLLDAYMEGGEPIKKDAVRLMFIMRVSPEQFALVWPQIESFFVLDRKGYLHHKRCNVELDRQDILTKHKSLGGIRSAAKRKEQREQYQLLGNSSSTAVQQQSERDVTALPPMECNVREGKIEIDSSAASEIHNATAETAAAPTLPSTEVKNGRSGKRGSRIAADWLPDQRDTEFAIDHGFRNGEITKAAAEFRDYWIAASGRNAIKLDWSATWRNRVRTLAERRPDANGSRPGTNRPGSGLVAAMRNAMPRSED